MRINYNLPEIINAAALAEMNADKIANLRLNDHPSLRILLRYGFSPDVFWFLPHGQPKDDYDPDLGEEGVLADETKRLYLFAFGGEKLSPFALWSEIPENLKPAYDKAFPHMKSEDLKQQNFKKAKRENTFLEILRACPPDDAKLLVAIKDRTIKGLTSDIVREAFPGIF